MEHSRAAPAPPGVLRRLVLARADRGDPVLGRTVRRRPIWPIPLCDRPKVCEIGVIRRDHPRADTGQVGDVVEQRRLSARRSDRLWGGRTNGVRGLHGRRHTPTSKRRDWRRRETKPRKLMVGGIVVGQVGPTIKLLVGPCVSRFIRPTITLIAGRSERRALLGEGVFDEFRIARTTERAGDHGALLHDRRI